ncbi:uncharacterized protein LOC123690682 [Pieris rapae]|uniref:uncharacterized protein LOC123690682 n=1 Tax=Pieris rapae TaxID=64459 RepID=UPI001E27D513|nr:uncharacterized protein LOC123690682 [Pieris rapae]
MENETTRTRFDAPLRAKSVCLSERPRSKYERNIRSADSNRLNFAQKQFIHKPIKPKPARKLSNVLVREQKRKIIEKKPCAVSIQNLSIPVRYGDDSKTNHSTSNRKTYNVTSDNRSFNPKQVKDKRLCQTIGGKETENKLLLQISEAEQVSDFERILNSNAILWKRTASRTHGHVWQRNATHTPTSFTSRPRSSYSLRAVSQAYHFLFRQHEESLQPLIDKYRQNNLNDHKDPSASLLDSNWFENLQDLSEFYEDDPILQREIETITDRIITEEVKPSEAEQTTTRSLFNVNLAELFGLHVNGDGVSPTYREEQGPSSVTEIKEHCDGKEWLDPIMSSSPNNRSHSGEDDSGVDSLSQNLTAVQIDSDTNVPTITFSNCCEGRSRADIPNNTNVIHLAVPTIEDSDESRPPMM